MGLLSGAPEAQASPRKISDVAGNGMHLRISYSSFHSAVAPVIFTKRNPHPTHAEPYQSAYGSTARQPESRADYPGGWLSKRVSIIWCAALSQRTPVPTRPLSNPIFRLFPIFICVPGNRAIHAYPRLLHAGFRERVTRETSRPAGATEDMDLSSRSRNISPKPSEKGDDVNSPSHHPSGLDVI